MAQVKEVTIRIDPLIAGYRNVNISAKLGFTEQEIGLRYNVSAALYGTDNKRNDPDNPNAIVFIPFWIEDGGVEKVQDVATDTVLLSISPLIKLDKMFRAITVTDPTMDFQVDGRILNEKLDEDPGSVLDFSHFPEPVFQKQKDEIFARVKIFTEGQSDIVQGFRA
jgi:hypothetical protein